MRCPKCGSEAEIHPIWRATDPFVHVCPNCGQRSKLDLVYEWSDAPPTAPGWYFVKLDSGVKLLFAVWKHRNGFYMYDPYALDGTRLGSSQPVDSIDGQWAGPLKAPS